MQILDRGYLPKPAEDSSYNSCSFPCIERLPSGRWLAAYKIGSTKGGNDCTAVLQWSDDRGQTWTPPRIPVLLPPVDGRPGTLRQFQLLSLGDDRVLGLANWVDHSEPGQPYYDPASEGLKDTRIFATQSVDGGEHWSTPWRVVTTPIDDPTPLTGPPLLLADGALVCQFEINKHLWDDSQWLHRSAMIFSHDGGRSWADPSIVTAVPDRYYWDQRPTVLSDGRSLVDFFWTLDGKRQQYLNIHARCSPDGGRNWGEMWDTGIYGQPGRPVDPGDGRLFTIDIDRSSRPRITVRASPDLGRSFTETLRIYDDGLTGQDSRTVAMREAWSEMARFSVGHPNLLDLGNGEILAYYYAGSHCDRTRIEFARIAIR